jgi:hypothetical protein
MLLFFLKREIGLSANLCMLSRFLVLVVLARNLICIRLMELQIYMQLELLQKKVYVEEAKFFFTVYLFS